MTDTTRNGAARTVRRSIPKKRRLELAPPAAKNGNGAKPEFAQLPHAILEDEVLTDAEFRVLAAVRSFAWKAQGRRRNPCTAALKEIGTRAGGKSEDRTRAALRSLVLKGYLTAESPVAARGGAPTIYRVADSRTRVWGRENRSGGVADSRGEGVADSRPEVEEVEVDELKYPPAPAELEEPNSKPVGWRRNSRAWGTNPRALDEAAHAEYVKACQKASRKMWDEIHAEIDAFAAAHPEVDPKGAHDVLVGPLYRRKMEALKEAGLFIH